MISEPKTDEMVSPGVRYAFGQYHATYTADGSLKSRYFATQQGAIAWRKRGIAKRDAALQARK
jgi:hypothetical protein